MTTKELTMAFEAVLFASGEPLNIDRFAQVFEITPSKTIEVMEKLSKKYEESDSGIKLVRLDNAYQLTTKSEYSEYIKKAFDIKRKTPLSPAALEVLAVVAYNQPVTKSFVEQVRGVDCSSVMTTLIEKGLVEERGRLELPGKPLLYGTTKNFLRCFGVSDLSELPPLPKTQQEGEVNDVGEQLSMDADNEQFYNFYLK